MWRATAYVQFCSHPGTESFPQSVFLKPLEVQGQHIWALEFLENCLQMPWLHLSTSFWGQVLIFIHLALCLRFGVGALFQIKPMVFFFCLKIYQIVHGTPLSCILRMPSNASGKTAVTEGVFQTVYLCCVNVYVMHVCGRILAMARLYS